MLGLWVRVSFCNKIITEMFTTNILKTEEPELNEKVFTMIIHITRGGSRPHYHRDWPPG